ncbi:MAG: hypothetical protein AAF483_17165 [Planctomycetota bacterium]
MSQELAELLSCVFEWTITLATGVLKTSHNLSFTLAPDYAPKEVLADCECPNGLQKKCRIGTNK